MDNFRLEAWRQGGEILAALNGRFTQMACAGVRMALTDLLTPAVEHFYVSLAELEFIDSSGLGTLIGLKMEANRSRSSMVLLRPSTHVREVFRISRLDSIFEIMDGLEAEMIVQRLRTNGTPLWVGSSGPSASNRDEFAAANQPPTDDDQGTGRGSQLCMDAVEYLRQGNLVQAMNAYQRARQLEPDNISILNNLGVICEKKPEWYEQGREVWERVLELSRRNQDEKHISRAQRHLEMLGKLIRIN